MRIYSSLTTEQLDAKISDLTGKLEGLQSGGGIAVIQGEGRRMEYTRGNSAGLQDLLKLALAERDRRAGTNPYGAIGVTFP